MNLLDAETKMHIYRLYNYDKLDDIFFDILFCMNIAWIKKIY